MTPSDEKELATIRRILREVDVPMMIEDSLGHMYETADNYEGQGIIHNLTITWLETGAKPGS